MLDLDGDSQFDASQFQTVDDAPSGQFEEEKVPGGSQMDSIIDEGPDLMDLEDISLPGAGRNK